MSVTLKSVNGEIEESLPNGLWKAICAHAAAIDKEVPTWNGNHDGQQYTPYQLRMMALRLQQSYEFVDALRALAANDGAILS